MLYIFSYNPAKGYTINCAHFMFTGGAQKKLFLIAFIARRQIIIINDTRRTAWLNIKFVISCAHTLNENLIFIYLPRILAQMRDKPAPPKDSRLRYDDDHYIY